MDISASKQSKETMRMLHGSFTHQESAIRYRSAPTKVQQVERRPTWPRPPSWPVRADAPTNNVGGSPSIRMILPYNSGPYLTRQTVSCSDLTAVSTGHLQHAYGHHSARRNPYGLETYL
jgi:hypothetical protein